MSEYPEFSPESTGLIKPFWMNNTVIPSYQRDVKRHGIDWGRDPEKFNPMLMEPITIAPHPGDDLLPGDKLLVPDGLPLYDIVDGLGRASKAVALFGPEVRLMARLLEINRSDQISAFIGLNRGHIRVTDFHVFQARYDDKALGAVILQDVVTEAGFKIASTSSVTGIKGIVQLQKFTGYSVTDETSMPSPDSVVALRKALYTIDGLWPKDSDSLSAKQRTNSAVVVGFARVFRDAAFPDGSSPDVNFVVERLAGTNGAPFTPGYVIREANEMRMNGTTLGGGDHLILPSARVILQRINKPRGPKLAASWFNKQ